MSSNVAGSSTGVPLSDRLTVEDVREFNNDELNAFLKRRLNGINNHIDRLTAQEVDSSAFLALKYEMLVSQPLNIPVGPAAKLTELIKEIQKEPGENEVALENFWQALKGDSYIDTDTDKYFTVYDNGYLYNFFRLDDKPYSFYIRDCYNHLLDIALDRNIRNLRITGNPGIGKTFFGYYLLYILAQNDITVIYEDYSMKDRVILFSQEKVSYLHSILDNNEIQSYLYKREVWYIVDGKTPNHSTAKTILICSPRKSHYTAFDKRNPTIRFMPVWSWEEIDECRAKFFDHLTKERVLELYEKWGGIPRYILECDNNPDTLNELEKAIELCDVSILKYIGGSDSTDIISHKIVHIYTNLPIEDGARNHDGSDEEIEYIDEGVPYTKTTIKFASDYVGRMVTTSLKATIINDLCRNIDAVLDGGKSDPVLGCLFEQIAHRMLRNGGKFKCRSLDTGDESDITIIKLNSILFSKVDDIKDKFKFYCQPLDKNFPSIDAIILPNVLLQMTTAKKHSIKMSGLKKVQTIFAEQKIIRFIFVVPAQLYDGYEKQVYATTNDEEARIVSPWIRDRVEQYVMKIDLSSERRSTSAESTSAETSTGEESHSTSDKTNRCNCKIECIYNCACRRSKLPCGNRCHPQNNICKNKGGFD